MNNGSNDWDVPFSHITWLERLLKNHSNVSSVKRTHDILFSISRKAQDDTLNLLCLREYTIGLTMIQRALQEFEDLGIIYIGGGWSGYTETAKDFCLNSNIGLYVTDEMSGALWKDEYWNYYRRDENGDPIRFIRAA